MVNYKYKAFDAGGRQISGEMAAPNVKTVEQKLQQQKLVPVYVLQAGKADSPKTAAAKPFQGRRKKMSLDEVCDLLRSMSVMSNSGVSLIDSLDTLAASATNPTVSDLVRNIKNEVLGGKTLARAMQAQGDVFPEIVTEMIAVADEGGKLGQALENTTAYIEMQNTTRKSIVGALVYPMLLMSMSMVTVAGFMIFILPTFGKTFEGMSIKLPLITEALLKTGTFLQNNFVGVFFGVLIGGFAFSRLLKVKSVKKWISVTLYKAPLAGKVAKQLALARSAA
ncbi:MAG: type II secretion system F family protein, partial [Armatimonadota bacterium]